MEEGLNERGYRHWDAVHAGEQSGRLQLVKDFCNEDPERLNELVSGRPLSLRVPSALCMPGY